MIPQSVVEYQGSFTGTPGDGIVVQERVVSHLNFQKSEEDPSDILEGP